MGYPISPAVMVCPLGAPRNNDDNDYMVEDIDSDDNVRSVDDDQDDNPLPTKYPTGDLLICCFVVVGAPMFEQVRN